MDHYRMHKKFHVAVDCIIFGFDGSSLRVLIHKRKIEPCRGEWSLFGGFVGKEEGLDEAAARVLYDLTGLRNIYMEQLRTYGDPLRDPAGRVVSVAYYALLPVARVEAIVGGLPEVNWISADELPQMVCDHRIMIHDGLLRLRERARTEPLGFELLPEKFTLPQIQRLYEAIYGRVIDARNFRKKILSLKVLEKLPQKDRTNSRKGAYLYTLNKTQFEHAKFQDFKISV